MKRIYVPDLTREGCASAIDAKMNEKRIAHQIFPEEQVVQVDACGPCAERLQKEGKSIEGCEKCVGMTLEIINALGYSGTLMK